MKRSFKWDKQQILMDFHIRDAESFEENVTIFCKNEKEEVISFIAKQKRQVAVSKDIYFVVILVPIEHEFKLRNIIIKEELDINYICELIEMDNTYSEIWVCTNWINKGESFSGRFCIAEINGVENHILEIINTDIPRNIEKVECHFKMEIKKKTINYYKYSRNRWGTRFRECVNQYENSEMDMITIQICQEIERKREQIDFLYSYLEKIGIKNLSLDFRFKNGRLEFIDWDTENDKFVTANLKRDEIY